MSKQEEQRGSAEHRARIVDYLSKLASGEHEGPVDDQAVRDAMQFWAADGALFVGYRRKLIIAQGALDALGVSVDYDTGKITPHAAIDAGSEIVLPFDALAVVKRRP